MKFLCEDILGYNVLSRLHSSSALRYLLGNNLLHNMLHPQPYALLSAVVIESPRNLRGGEVEFNHMF